MAMKPLITTLPVLLALAGCSTQLLQPRQAERQTGHCADGICLIYLQNVLDSDSDGFSDSDEIAMGTDPKDSASYPKTLDVVARLQERDLRSFNLGISQILVLPEKDPAGNTLVPAGIGSERKNSLEALGISVDKLDKLGASFNDGFALNINSAGELQRPANGRGSGPPELQLALIRTGLFRSDTAVTEWSNWHKPDLTATQKKDYPNIEVRERTVTVTNPDGSKTTATQVETKGTENNTDPKKEFKDGVKTTDVKDTPAPKKYCADDPCGPVTVATVPQEARGRVDAKLKGTVRPVQDPPPSPVKDGSPIVTLDKKRNTIILTDPDKTDFPLLYKSMILTSMDAKFFDRKTTNTTPGPKDILGDVRPGSGRP